MDYNLLLLTDQVFLKHNMIELSYGNAVFKVIKKSSAAKDIDVVTLVERRLWCVAIFGEIYVER